jgi:hypothetical protein
MRALLALLALASLPTLAAGLNDTGVYACYDGANMVACTTANAGNAALYPSQDARYGRDAAQAAGLLPAKVGGGAAGFDFTPLDASGNVIALTGTPPVPAATPACTRDNVTGLVWEVKTAANMNGTFTWAAAANYASSANSAGLCGAHSGWRVPTRRELLSIVHRGTSNPAIDTHYFPNTTGDWFWSSDIYAPSPAYAWVVDFYDGYAYANSQSGNVVHVRLVRSGQ